MSMSYDLGRYCARFCVEKGLTEEDAVDMFECTTGILEWDYHDDKERDDEFNEVIRLYGEYAAKKPEDRQHVV